MTERRTVALVSAAATYVFFVEYLWPLKRVHMFSDIEGFHAPLLAYAFGEIRHGHFPLWDASIYCGIPFAGNIQAALFYPGTWLLFLGNIGQPHLRFKILELFVFAHVWLAFYLCYRWLRLRRMGLFAALSGASVFALGGYMISQIVHVGVVTGYAWTPLAWMGIDETARIRSWKPLWKTAAASALCFLAGYPATWVAFAIATCVYALASAGVRIALTAGASIAFSLALAAVQLLPAATASAMKTFDPKYGFGVRDLEFYLALVVPNYFDLGRNVFGWGDPHGMYIYVGVPAIFGLLWAARARRREWLPAGAVLAVCFVFLSNPFNIVSSVLEANRLSIQLVHTINFIEPATLAIAMLTAAGIEAFLKQRIPLAAARGSVGFGGPLPDGRGSAPLAEPHPFPRGTEGGQRGRRMPITCSTALCHTILTVLTVAALTAWSVRQIRLWLPGGGGFAALGWSAFDMLIPLALFALGLTLMRTQTGARRAVLAAALLTNAAVDYKVFGTSRLFNTSPDDVDRYFPRGMFLGMANPAYDVLKAHRESRIAIDDAPHGTEMRRYRLTTPQGFDPLLPAQYKAVIERHKPFRTDRLFDIAPGDDALLTLLGVRYFITHEKGPFYSQIESDPDWRFIGPEGFFHRVYEYLPARPPWRWEGGTAAVTPARWTAEVREFRVDAATAGRLVMIEQFYPGWRVSIDGRSASLEKWGGAFQSVSVPAGPHTVRFRYLPLDLFAGAAISLCAMIALIWFARR